MGRRYIEPHEAFCAYLQLHATYGLYISFDEASDTPCPHELRFVEMQKAAPFLVLPDDGRTPYDHDIQALFNGAGYFAFDSEEEMLAAYDTCYMDGPTRSNPTGSAYFRCYAVTFGPWQGQYRVLNENT